MLLLLTIPTLGPTDARRNPSSSTRRLRRVSLARLYYKRGTKLKYVRMLGYPGIFHTTMRARARARTPHKNAHARTTRERHYMFRLLHHKKWESLLISSCEECIQRHMHHSNPAFYTLQLWYNYKLTICSSLPRTK